MATLDSTVLPLCLPTSLAWISTLLNAPNGRVQDVEIQA